MSATIARKAQRETRHESKPCSAPGTCAALVSLGYNVVHCGPGEPWGLMAFPNSHTATLGTPRWIATPNTASGFPIGELRVIAQDRGGRVLWAEESAE